MTNEDIQIVGAVVRTAMCVGIMMLVWQYAFKPTLVDVFRHRIFCISSLGLRPVGELGRCAG